MPREAFSRRTNAELVARSLNQLDIPASVNERHDIVVDNHKVSGSAYKITSARAYHHGTMLIDADTQTLKNCLSKKRMNNVSFNKKETIKAQQLITYYILDRYCLKGSRVGPFTSNKP